VLITDPNNTVTQMSFNDPLDRLSQVVRALGTGLQNQTTYTYPNLLTVSSQKDQYRDNDPSGIQSTTTTDGLGRTTQTQLVTPQGTLTTLTDLDSLGRARKVHNPGYGSADPNNFSTYTYDAQNRLTTTQYADGSTESFTWNGDTVTHTDPVGAKTQQQVDALGRILQVVEDPNGPNQATTTYAYDALAARG
jgi:YD repeat-containing protein